MPTLYAPLPVEDLIPTGEPCRCPEHLLDCICGAYAKVEVAR